MEEDIFKNLKYKNEHLYLDKNDVDFLFFYLDKFKEKNKKLEEENEIIKGNYNTLCADIQMVTSELGFPEDTIIADEMVSMIKENYIPVSLVEEKIEELDEDLEIMKVDAMYGRYKKYGSKLSFEKQFSYKYGMHDVLQELLEKRK